VYAVHTVMILVTFGAVASFLLNLFIQWPIASFWDPNVKAVWSLNQIWLFPSLYITDVLADIILLCLPLFVIQSLRMSTGDKFALAGIFALGAVASVAGIAQLVYEIKLYQRGGNTTTNNVSIFVWAILEPCLGIICTCLPLLHPYFKRHAPEVILGASRSGYGPIELVQPTANVYRDQRDMSLYMDKVHRYHENVIE